MLTFKSKPEFFYKERNGLKPNTVRKVDPDDPRLILLNDTDNPPKEIMITNADNSVEYFIRTITDISFYAGQWIISWKHPMGELHIPDKEQTNEEKKVMAQLAQIEQSGEDAEDNYQG